MTLAARISEVVSSHDRAQMVTAYLDEGMKRQPVTLPNGCVLTADCDSKEVIGIQLADCCAHFVATILLGELGLFTKMVPRRRVYPDEQGDLELAWELWASIRYALAGSEPISPMEDDGYYEPLLKPFGLVLSEGCDKNIVEAAEKRFGSVWVGCVH